MSSPQEVIGRRDSSESLAARFDRIRQATLGFCTTLAVEDFVVQSMPDVSPTKWHLAHVTWFFEKFLLEPGMPGYKPFNEQFHFLFNSYYVSAGDMHARPLRGLLTRPTVAEILKYREHVDDAMRELIAAECDTPGFADVVLLGLNHEQQHQELLLTDIKHVFWCNPMQAAVHPALAIPASTDPGAYRFVEGTSGIHEIGADGVTFCFDNETPRHRALLHPHEIGKRLITNGEYLEFIRDDGYGNAALWLSDGWTMVNEQRWSRPLYWNDGLDSEFTLGGVRDLDLHAPVIHLSYYEADAYARWAGARLPTEAEWEVRAASQPVTGNFVDRDFWQPVSAGESEQFFGDAWEWTSSSYAPYPGFKPLPGSLGEYNGKFMCNQMSVRGGSCVTSLDHIRPSYRSFFYPQARWQFLGLRLARDIDN